ncbi:MAG: Hint domain-containing protein [Paracoccus sp. (in: a-proteobacteria)]|jgi:hypothetical protein
MPEHTFTKVYQLSDVNWNPAVNVANGAALNSTFTVNGGGAPLKILDNDDYLEDNNNDSAGMQTLDASQQTLVGDFGQNHDGDYVWSRAYQNVVDQYGNVGRIYQIRIATYTGSGMPDYNSTNVHTYYAFSGPLVIAPGIQYTVTGAFSGMGNQRYMDFAEPVTCFSADAMISTAAGTVAAGALKVGMQVQTRDNGLQTVRWVGRRVIGADELAAAPKLRPIRIKAGALGPDMPAQDLVVSPQHRLLVRSKIAVRLFDAPEILVAAKQLLSLDGVEVAEDVSEVTYVHLMFDRHEIVWANGAETESLYAGPQALRGVGPEALDELFEIFPELRDGAEAPKPARPLVEGKAARKLARIHAKNGVDLVAASGLN